MAELLELERLAQVLPRLQAVYLQPPHSQMPSQVRARKAATPTQEPASPDAPSGEVLAVEVRATTAPIVTAVAVQCMGLAAAE